MNKDYKVTVAIALYNCEKYIVRCLDSVLNQTYKNIEIVVINDGSTDNSKELVEKMNINNKINIYNKENGGLASARNYGLYKATGKFILFIDSDDWLENNAIEEMVKKQIEYNCDIVKSNYYINKIENKNYTIMNCKKYNNTLVNLKENKENKENILNDIIIGNIGSYTWSMLIRKSIILPEYDFENVRLEDKMFLIKLINNVESIYFFNKPLYHYFYNLNGIMHKDSLEFYLQNSKNVNYTINKICKSYYKNYKRLSISNNTISSYSIERDLFNLFNLFGRDKAIENFLKIKNFWSSIWDNCDFSIFKNSDYGYDNSNIVELWKNEMYNKIFKIYRIQKVEESIKNKLRKVKNIVKSF